MKDDEQIVAGELLFRDEVSVDRSRVSYAQAWERIANMDDLVRVPL